MSGICLPPSLSIGCIVLQATSPARPDAGQPSGRVAAQSGQYLPGLAPATELRKRTSELRQQHLAKLQRLAGGQVASFIGNSPGKQLSLLHALISLFSHINTVATELCCWAPFRQASKR